MSEEAGKIEELDECEVHGLQKISLVLQRGSPEEGTHMEEHMVEVDPASVVLDAVHCVQSTKVPDLAVRWNCKAGKCGSCSAEVNGQPKLMCMTKLSDYPELTEGRSLEIRPLRAFPLLKDLVTDVSWNYEVNKRIRPFKPPTDGQPLIMTQEEVDRVQEFRKCIECFLCQGTCHVVRTHGAQEVYAGPRYLVRVASLEMHPMDQDDRLEDVRDDGIGVGYCNITKCCTEVCPESIRITDNAIIPMKERVVTRYYDPLAILFRKLFRRK